ncbi:MAG: CBS domain-containing protein [Candidatus Caldarchaeales archaeon]|jgi:CBS domain-containing protein|nr:CBS domain-containing protein [Candidatus Caldarchaeales archaeon]
MGVMLKSGTTYLVRDVMSRFVVTVRPEDTAWTALELMVSRGVGALVVVEGNRPIGIVTERDILRRLLRGSGPEELLTLLVRDVMTKEPIVCTPETPLRDVLRTMVERGFRRMPVVKNGLLEGIVTERDCMVFLLKLLGD